MQKNSDISALMHDTRNIYIAIAALALIVGLGPSGLRMPAYAGVMGLVAWLIWLSVQGKTPRQFPVKKIFGVVADLTPMPTARAPTISKYPNSGTVDGAMRFRVGGQLVYMKCLAPLQAGDAVVAAVIPNESKDGPCADASFEVLTLRDDSRSDGEGRYLKIPDARMIVPTGTRLWIVVASMVLLIGFVFPIYFIAIIKRSYDVKFGWERAIAEAERLVDAGGGGSPAATNALATELLA
jgi:hypothetical protein